MSFLFRNISTISIAIVVCGFAWLFGGTRPDLLRPVVPWLYALMFEMVLCFPQHYRGETTAEARERVWLGLKRDPITWVLLAFFALLAVALANKGLCPSCDAEVIAAGGSAHPELPFLPFCVDRLEHYTTVLWFVPALTATLVVRHALLKPGKRTLVSLIVWNGLLLAVFGCIEIATGATGPFWAVWTEGPYGAPPFFSTFGYTNMAGDYFTTLFALSIALWRWRVEEVSSDVSDSRLIADQRGHGSFWRRHYHLIPAGCFFYAALNTLSRAAIMSVTALAIVFFFHAATCFLAKMPRAKRMKMSAVCAPILLAILSMGVLALPDDVVKEIDNTDDIEILDRVSGRGQYHVTVAKEIWKDHKLFGCGGWGYRHFSPIKLKAKKLGRIQDLGGANAHNDYMQFLAEHGVVGLGLLLAVVILLIAPVWQVWQVLVKTARFMKPKERPPYPLSVFAMPAPVFCILAGCVSTFIHAFGDCPLRSPAILSLFFVSFAVLPGFLPSLHRDSQG